MKDTKDMKIQETAFFLMDHTDWRAKMLDQGMYLSAAYYYANPEMPTYTLNPKEAEKKILSLYEKAEDLEEWECFMYDQYDLPEGLRDVDVVWDIADRIESGDRISDIVAETYEDIDVSKCVFSDVCNLVGGPDVMREITNFALSIKTESYEAVYVQLREKYSGSSWYIA